MWLVEDGIGLRDRQTSSIHDLLCVAREGGFSSLGIDVKLFSASSEIFDESSKDVGRDAPLVLRGVLIEKGMHDFNRFICKSICLGDP